ncbi:MAG: TlpA disulfide reductase family protein [Ferruginibacter sp.]
MNKRSIYLVAVVLVVAASFIIIRKLKNHYAPRINLSGISLKDLDGKVVDLAAFSGKPLVINFWGTWCPPCREELPAFQKARDKYGDEVNILMASDEPVDKISKFKKENNYTFIYTQLQNTFHDLGITSVPVTYFYNARGNLVIKKKDPLTEEELDGFISEIIK